MNGTKNKKQIAKMSILIASIFVIIISITYAFITQTLVGTKRQVITVGVLDLVLDEENEISISDALPMYDNVGMIQEENYVFRLINNTSNDTNYIMKLNKVNTSDLDESLVKYGLVKDGDVTIALLSTLEDGVIDEGTIEGSATQNYELRLWIDSSVKNKTLITGKTLSYTLSVEVNQEIEKQTIMIGGISQEVETTKAEMFNYTSAGCTIDEGVQTCPVEVTNGLYMMEDDNGPSYYYRGEVNNLVKFGSYTKDYEVYRYDIYDFVTLEACKYYNSNCSESNKVTKYAAVDNLPMYWKIIRVNGDGTIRMIYAGTTPNATGLDAGIGLSRYNEEKDDPKYTGYTYDRTTNEVDSDIKTEIDAWYANVFEGTTYDNKIATGKFCSDSSNYGEVTDIYNSKYNVFGSFKRLFQSDYNLEGDSSPTFKCPTTSETYGGSYNLKVGLITSDEVVAAGGQNTSNDSYCLYNGNKGKVFYDGYPFWSMSPAYFRNGVAYAGNVNEDGSFGVYYPITSDGTGLLRPVINLRADVIFKDGTDGSVLTPYELTE